MRRDVRELNGKSAPKRRAMSGTSQIARAGEFVLGHTLFDACPFSASFYRPQAGGIVLVRVIHGARDLPALFSATET